MFLRVLAIFILLCLSCAPAQAQDTATAPGAPPQLMIPAACTLGADCWVVNYIDTDPAEGSARDYQCGPRTYDEHDGLDFGIRDRVTMEMGVGVVAAAPGKIVRVRDGQPDRQPTDDDIKTMLASNLGCGNGVLIDHGRGWQSISCHMKQGSITVKPGDSVQAGQRIGEIGQSGAAEFPHLHFSLFNNGTIIDPATGDAVDGGCGGSDIAALWLPGLNVPYDPVVIYGAGFVPGEPFTEALRIDAQSPATIRDDAPALSFWVGVFGARKGDRIALDITDPFGREFVRRDIVQDKDRARQFYYIGRRVRDPLTPGPWVGRARLERDGDGVTAQPVSRAAERIVTVSPAE